MSSPFLDKMTDKIFLSHSQWEHHCCHSVTLGPSGQVTVILKLCSVELVSQERATVKGEPDYPNWGPRGPTFLGGWKQIISCISTNCVLKKCFRMLFYTFCHEAMRKCTVLKLISCNSILFAMGQRERMCCFIAYLMILFTFPAILHIFSMRLSDNLVVLKLIFL
jgi:hypothetical protein